MSSEMYAGKNLRYLELVNHVLAIATKLPST